MSVFVKKKIDLGDRSFETLEELPFPGSCINVYGVFVDPERRWKLKWVSAVEKKIALELPLDAHVWRDRDFGCLWIWP